MLSGVSGQDLMHQWNALPPLTAALTELAPRLVQRVTGWLTDRFAA